MQTFREDLLPLLAMTPHTLQDNQKSAILKKSDAVRWYTKKKNMDWFDENDKETQDLLTVKREYHDGYLAQPACPIRKDSCRLACNNP